MQRLPHKLSWAITALALLGSSGVAHAQEWRTIHTQRSFLGEELLRVTVEYGAGRLVISPDAASSLFRAKLRYDGNVFRPVNRYDESERSLRIGVEGGSVKGANLKAGQLDLALSTRVPLELALRFGATEASLELGGLRVREASIETGASETRVSVSRPNPVECGDVRFQIGAARFEATGLANLNCENISLAGGVGEVILDFSGEWRTNTNVDVDMGLGSLTLRVPKGLGVSIRKTGVLAAFDSEGLIKRGNVYYSENFQHAEHKLNLTIDAALGAIKVQWVDGALGSR
jgi:cell wall-active antibiotic response 4TMS protein YvqF/uncharacterized protein DUF2154